MTYYLHDTLITHQVRVCTCCYISGNIVTCKVYDRSMKQYKDSKFIKTVNGKRVFDRAAHQAAIVERNVKFVEDYLLTHPCVDCGSTDIVMLDFDHVDPSTKVKGGVAKMIHNRTSLETLRKEIEKCEVRCVRCHRLKTWDDNHWRAKYA